MAYDSRSFVDRLKRKGRDVVIVIQAQVRAKRIETLEELSCLLPENGPQANLDKLLGRSISVSSRDVEHGTAVVVVLMLRKNLSLERGYKFAELI